MRAVRMESHLMEELQQQSIVKIMEKLVEEVYLAGLLGLEE